MEIKGTAIRSLQLAIERVGHEGGARRVIEALPADVRDELPRVLPGSWYPIRIHAELHEAVRAVLGKGSFIMNRRVGQEAAKNDFQGVYRALVWMLGCATTVRNAPRTWTRYNSRGEMFIDELSQRSTRVRVVDVDSYTEAMWNGVAGRFEAALVLSGARAAHVNITTCSSTDAAFDIGWSVD